MQTDDCPTVQDFEGAWKIEKELCDLTRCPNVGEALCVLGLLSNPALRFRLNAGQWVRGGAETYLSKFELLSQENPVETLLIKACVTFSPGVTLDSVLDEWLRRRRLLAENGIKTPYLYGAGSGLLIEEYIPHPLRDVLLVAENKPSDLLDQLTHYAATLCKLGFAPISPFKDLRSHGTDLVVVDFGSDLGPPGIRYDQRSKIFQMLHEYIFYTGISLKSHEYDRLRALFAFQAE